MCVHTVTSCRFPNVYESSSVNMAAMIAVTLALLVSDKICFQYIQCVSWELHEEKTTVILHRRGFTGFHIWKTASRSLTLFTHSQICDYQIDRVNRDTRQEIAVFKGKIYIIYCYQTKKIKMSWKTWHKLDLNRMKWSLNWPFKWKLS